MDEVREAAPSPARQRGGGTGRGLLKRFEEESQLHGGSVVEPGVLSERRGARAVEDGEKGVPNRENSFGESLRWWDQAACFLRSLLSKHLAGGSDHST